MNYLAHCHLSGNNDSILMGNFLADMLKPKEVDQLSDAWKKGVILHRHIDYFTDNHPSVRAATALIRDTQGKYAPVVTDVFYDYFLSKNWHLFFDQSVEKFILDIYDRLNHNMDEIPSRAIPKVMSMIENDIISNYTSINGIKKTMAYLTKRAKFASGFSMAVSELVDHMDALEKTFIAFYPDLLKSVKQLNLDSSSL